MENSYPPRKLLAFVLAVLLAFSCSSIGLRAQNRTVEANPSRQLPNMQSAQGQRLEAVFNDKIAELQEVALADLAAREANSKSAKPISFELSISRVAELRDFAGNLYTLVEMDPSGYMIYHNDSGIFVERSAAAPSPYAGLSGDLLYGGFSEYLYQRQDGDYVHTKTNKVVDAAVAVANDWEGHSNRVAEPLLADPDFAVLDYIEHNIAPPKVVMDSGFTCVDNYTFVQSQTAVTNPDERCGYVALAILIGYFDHVPANRNMGIINNAAYVTNRHTSTAKVQNAFVDHLVSIGQGFGYGLGYYFMSQMRNVGRQYFKNRGVWDKITDQIDNNWISTTIAKMKKNIDNNRAIMLQDVNLPGTNGGHAVVAYGYRNECLFKDTFRVNYGWGAGGDIGGRPYSDVWVTGATWEAMLTFVVTP